MEAAGTLAAEHNKTHLDGPAWISDFRILGLPLSETSDAEVLCRYLFAKQTPDGFLPSDNRTGAAALPIQGLLLEQLRQSSKKSAAFLAPALRAAFHRAMAWHRYLYEHRDPAGEGLLIIQHPDEDGFGNAPGYPLQPFQIQDPFFNTCLAASNEALVSLGHFLKEDIGEASHWYELTVHTMNEKLWNGKANCYHAFDLSAGQLISVPTLAGLLPMLAEVPDQAQAERMLTLLESQVWKDEDYRMYPSCSIDRVEVDTPQGWNGAVSPALNWMLYKGLKRYDFNETAERLRRHTLQLVSEYGFHTAYDSRKQKQGHPGIGAPSSAAAAALALHWLLK